MQGSRGIAKIERETKREGKGEKRKKRSGGKRNRGGGNGGGKTEYGG